MRYLGERVGLVHKLGKLGAAEEFPDGGYHGADIDQGAGSNGLRANDTHALPDRLGEAQQANVELGLYQLADRTYTPVAKVVDIIAVVSTVIDQNDVPDNLDHVVFGQGALLQMPERLFKRGVELEKLLLVVKTAGQYRF
jgi:hypothetical protein